MIAKNISNPLAKSFIALIKDSSIYMLGAAMLGLGNFILVPLYTRYLAPSEFGVYTLVEVGVLAAVLVSQLGLTVSYLKWFADTGLSRRGELLGSTLSISTLMAILSGGGLVLFVTKAQSGLWLQATGKSFAWMLLPIVVLESLQGLLMTDLRARREAVAYSVAMVVRLFAIVGVSLLSVATMHQGVAGIFLGRLVGDGLSVLLLSVFALRSCRFRISRTLASSMIRYGLPLAWAMIISVALDASGRYFLNHYSTLDQVGYYGVAVKISGVFQMLVVQPFGIAWGGLMFQIVQWRYASVIFSKALVYVFVLSLTSALILSIFTPTLFAIFTTPSYAPATAVFPLILLVRATNIMIYPAPVGIYVSGRTGWFVLIYSVGLVLDLILNYLLVPTFGIFGAGWAWLITWGGITGLMVLIGQKYYSLQYNWALLVLPIVLWGVTFTITQLVNMSELSSKLSWLVRILLVAVILLLVGGVLLKDFLITKKQVL